MLSQINNAFALWLTLGLMWAWVASNTFVIVGAVFLVHVLGFGLGYALARLCRLPMRDARTVSIEVGMHNSGLGAKLAATHFANPLTPVPAALSAVFHCLIGSALAAWWRRK